MSAENYIPSAASAIVEIAKQILASHGVDVDGLFDAEVAVEVDGTSQAADGVEVASGESADAIFDIDIKDPKHAVQKMVDEGMPSEAARAEYAQDLSDQIELMQADIMEYEMRNNPNAVLKGKLNELYDRLSLLRDDINGGSTDADALQGYYDRLDRIKKDGVKLA